MSPRMHARHRETHIGRAHHSAATALTTGTSSGATPESTQSIRRPPGYGWAQLGVKVLLRSDSGYSPTRSNPMQGSDYVCKGVIHTITHAPNDPNGRPVDVHWENGHTNGYFFEDLEPCKSESLWGEVDAQIKKKKEKKEKKGPMFNRGDVVFLKPGFKKDGHEQPALGTRYQCPGVVELALHAKVKVQLTVKWDNSLRGIYDIRYDTEKNSSKCMLINAKNGDELRRFIEENPNFAYKAQKGGICDNYGMYNFFRTAMGIEGAPSDDKPEQTEHVAQCLTTDEEVESSSEGVVSDYVTFDLKMPPNLDASAWELPHKSLDDEDPEGN